MTLNQPISRRGRGFTLAELLVAMGITAIILTLLVTVTGVALDGWRVSRNKVRAARQAKSALDQFSRDFESMVVRSGNNFEWLDVESKDNNLGPANNPSPNAARLIFFTAATDRYDGDIGGNQDMGGDVSAVGYELFFKNPITGSTTEDEENQPVFALYRRIVNPDETFEKLLAKEDLKAEFDRLPGETDRTNNFLCENIYEMSVVFLVEYSEAVAGGRLETKQQRVPVISTGSGDVVKNFSMRGSGIEVDGSPADKYGRGRIVAVDISVSVITDAAMSRLRSTGIAGTAKEKLIAGNTFNYVKTILLPQP
jgi:prepilin-type N-terminal cleavage/methylation domain-containing protein